jgi:hypothetical protein
MATNLKDLEAQLEAKQQEVRQAQELKIEQMMAKRKAEQEAKEAAEAAKSNEEKAADLQAKIAELEAHLTELHK